MCHTLLKNLECWFRALIVSCIDEPCGSTCLLLQFCGIGWFPEVSVQQSQPTAKVLKSSPLGPEIQHSPESTWNAVWPDSSSMSISEWLGYLFWLLILANPWMTLPDVGRSGPLPSRYVSSVRVAVQFDGDIAEVGTYRSAILISERLLQAAWFRHRHIASSKILSKSQFERNLWQDNHHEACAGHTATALMQPIETPPKSQFENHHLFVRQSTCAPHIMITRRQSINTCSKSPFECMCLHLHANWPHCAQECISNAPSCKNFLGLHTPNTCSKCLHLDSSPSACDGTYDCSWKESKKNYVSNIVASTQTHSARFFITAHKIYAAHKTNTAHKTNLPESPWVSNKQVAIRCPPSHASMEMMPKHLGALQDKQIFTHRWLHTCVARHHIQISSVVCTSDLSFTDTVSPYPGILWVNIPSRWSTTCAARHHASITSSDSLLTKVVSPCPQILWVNILSLCMYSFAARHHIRVSTSDFPVTNMVSPH